VLPIPAEDIPQLAPQLTFYGLDTLGIRVLGTAGWAEEEVLRGVSRRHTDGVVVATPYRAGENPPGHAGFVAAYESRFRRSVRDAVPALGWDAASLLLLALRSGARTPNEVARALSDVRGFPGATGVLSMEDGRIVREHYLVCLQDGRPLPLAADRAARPAPRAQPPALVDAAPIPGAGPACPATQAADRSGGAAAPSLPAAAPLPAAPPNR